MLSWEHVDAVREAEIDRVMPHLPPGARILDVGAGTGKQALELEQRGFKVTAIDLPVSSYATHRVFPVIDYDGSTIPLPDGSVDVVFSSNVLEHVVDLRRMHSEIRRVLASGGQCIHVLPTHAWRFWTMLAGYPDAAIYVASSVPQLLPRAPLKSEEARRIGRAMFSTAVGAAKCLPWRHGERGTAVSELWLFHPRWWRRNFRENGFVVVHDEPMGLFYTGNMLLGQRLNMPRRERLAGWLGSASHLFKLVPKKA